MCQWMIWKIKGQDKFGYKSWLRLISLTEWWGSGLYAENLYSSKTKMRSFKKKTLLILKIALILREEAGEGTERMPSFPPQTPGQHGCTLQDHFCVILCEHIKGRQRRRLPHALGHCLGALETVEIWNFLYKGKMPWCHCPFKTEHTCLTGVYSLIMISFVNKICTKQMPPFVWIWLEMTNTSCSSSEL